MERFKLSVRNRNEALRKSARVIEKGGVVVCPTDTVYGLLADVTNKKAAQKIFEIKKRPKEKAIPIFVSNIEMARKFAHITASKEQFLKTVWPGQVTAVLKRKKTLFVQLAGKKTTIALRVPHHQFITLLFKKVKKPLAGTSANISGTAASTKIGHILAQFITKKIQPDLVIDAGDLPKSLPSTIIDLTASKFKIIRKGAYTYGA